MARTVVLLNSKKEQITNSAHQLQAHVTTPLINFPASGAMPETIEWDGMEFTLMDQPTHQDDHAGAELFRYIEKAEPESEEKELARIAAELPVHQPGAADGGSARIASVKQSADEMELARIAAALKKK